MGELWDIYDKDKNLTGRFAERDVTRLNDGEYHLVVQAWIVNSEGEWLISQRSPKKRHGLKWEPTGGAVTAGESSLIGAVREAEEELGVKLDSAKGKLYKTYCYDRPVWSTPAFLDVWVFKCDWPIEKVVLQETETINAMWADADKIHEMIASGEFIETEHYCAYINELLEEYKINK